MIQTISAVDKDEPLNGHRFYFALAAPVAGNLNFTLRDNKGITAGFLIIITVCSLVCVVEIQGEPEGLEKSLKVSKMNLVLNISSCLFLAVTEHFCV